MEHLLFREAILWGVKAIHPGAHTKDGKNESYLKVRSNSLANYVIILEIRSRAIILRNGNTFTIPVP